jgi:pimeloyl-ACP methyl ester carboxylesterase
MGREANLACVKSASGLYYDIEGEGPVVVLIHEGILDSRMWDEQVGAFAERYRVVRYDLRGFGRSPAPDAPYSDVDDLAALLDDLGIERAALVGASKGGSIAINFTLTFPPRVWALVPVASGLGGFRMNPYSAQQDERYDAAVDAGDWQAAADVDIEVWAPMGSEGRVGELVYANARAAETEHYAQPLDPPAIGRLDEIHVPTLVITGDRDVPEMTEIGDVLEREIEGARRVRIAEADHIVPMRQPAEFNRIVLDFLSAVAPVEIARPAPPGA